MTIAVGLYLGHFEWNCALFNVFISVRERKVVHYLNSSLRRREIVYRFGINIVKLIR